MKAASAYDLILFDVDDTLLDFGRARDHSLARVLEAFAPGDDHDLMTPRFHAINAALWKDLERGAVTKDEVLIGRFERLFAEFALDGAAASANELFLAGLAAEPFLLEGAEDLVQALVPHVPLGIISNGHGPTQRKRLARAGLARHFAFSLISDEVGAAKPDRQIFLRALAEARLAEGARVLMIGDNLDADIAGARAVGFDTCWVSSRELPVDAPAPTFKASTLPGVAEWLRQ